MSNKINVSMTDEAVRTVNDALNVIERNMNFLRGLDKGESKSIQRIDNRRYAFVKKAIGFALAIPDLRPNYANLEEANTDLKLYEQLDTIEMRLGNLSRKVSDTRALAGSEAFATALHIYELAKIATKKGIAGVSAAYEEMKQFFQRQGVKPKKP
jgi:hypothetical protein